MHKDSPLVVISSVGCHRRHATMKSVNHFDDEWNYQYDGLYATFQILNKFIFPLIRQLIYIPR